MGVSVTFTVHTPEVLENIDNQIKERMQDSCMAVRAKAIELIMEPKHGRIYTTYFYTDKQGRIRPVGKRWKPHQASAPGEPPAQDTGELVQSIAIEVSEDGREGAVGTDKEHGKYMELGTSKVEPRPWLVPAFEQSEDEIKNIFTRDWE